MTPSCPRQRRRPPALAATLLALLAVSLLAGCASKPVAEAPRWAAELAAAQTRFAIRGKVGFRRGESGGSAALTWQQEGERYRLAANGPLGQGATRITGNAGQVRIENSEGVRESDVPETLLAEAIGWPVSINSLSWWVRGLPAPGSAAEVDKDAEGRPVRIRQQDWDILLDRWRDDTGVVLPYRVIATGGDSRVTLLIERWEFPPAARPARAAPAAAGEPAASGSAATPETTGSP